MVELPLVASQAEDQVAQALFAAQLGIEHGHWLRPVGQFPGVGTLPGMGLHLVRKNLSRDKLEHLTQNSVLMCPKPLTPFNAWFFH
jgi:hypothetical protein